MLEVSGYTIEEDSTPQEMYEMIEEYLSTQKINIQTPFIQSYDEKAEVYRFDVNVRGWLI